MRRRAGYSHSTDGPGQTAGIPAVRTSLAGFRIVSSCFFFLGLCLIGSRLPLFKDVGGAVHAVDGRVCFWHHPPNFGKFESFRVGGRRRSQTWFFLSICEAMTLALRCGGGFSPRILSPGQLSAAASGFQDQTGFFPAPAPTIIDGGAFRVLRFSRNLGPIWLKEGK